MATAKSKVLARMPMAVAVKREDAQPTRWEIRPHGETLERIGEAAHRESWAWAEAWRNLQAWQRNSEGPDGERLEPRRRIANGSVYVWLPVPHAVGRVASGAKAGSYSPPAGEAGLNDATPSKGASPTVRPSSVPASGAVNREAKAHSTGESDPAAPPIFQDTPALRRAIVNGEIAGPVRVPFTKERQTGKRK